VGAPTQLVGALLVVVPILGFISILFFQGYHLVRELFFSTNCFYSKISNYLCKIQLISLRNCFYSKIINSFCKIPFIGLKIMFLLLLALRYQVQK
jgi:hypothetical protein